MKNTEPSTPPVRKILERPRLLNQLDETKARTILLVAPAGYGKTTLLRQWAQANPRACWYTAESGSSDLAQLANGLASALEPIAPGLTTYVAQVVGVLSNPRRQVTEIVDAFCSRLGKTREASLVLDDYHLLADNSSGERLIVALRDRVAFQLLIGSRGRPAWASAREVVYGSLLEIGPEELALTATEATEVLSDSPQSLSKFLLGQAHGWPAVIGIAALTRSGNRAPSNGVSTTLYRFFADELFASAGKQLQEHLLTMSLLPSLRRDVRDLVFEADGMTVLSEAAARGFVTATADGHELHPLIREYLLARLSLEADVDTRADDAIRFSISIEAWDHAFSLIKRFGLADHIETFLCSGFKALIRSGRISTLEEVAEFARSRSLDFSPSVTLVDAELALRDGMLSRAEALGVRAAAALGSEHELTGHAHWVAGQGAQLRTNYPAARDHFRLAREFAHDDADRRDALWGLVLTSTYSELPTAAEAVRELQERRDSSPTDLVRATTALITLQRYTTGFEQPVEVADAIHALDAVSDPRIRTSFTNTHAYHLLVRADYYGAKEIASITREQASQYHLGWIIPHAEWALAAAALGRREFTQSEKLLGRVERTAERLRDAHLLLNSAALRARLLLALKRPHEAIEAIIVDYDLVASPAMTAEVLATSALVAAVLDEGDRARLQADQAVSLTRAVDVIALAMCARALSVSSDEAALAAFTYAEQHGAWDALVSAIRAEPALLERLAAMEACRPFLQTLLRRCNDFDLGRRFGIPVGVRPQLKRPPLTPREREVLQLVGQGLTNKEIATILYIGSGTVKVHLRHILEKTGTHTRTEAARQVDMDT